MIWVQIFFGVFLMTLVILYLTLCILANLR